MNGPNHFLDRGTEPRKCQVPFGFNNGMCQILEEEEEEEEHEYIKIKYKPQRNSPSHIRTTPKK